MKTTRYPKSGTRKGTPEAARIFLLLAREILSVAIWAGAIFSFREHDFIATAGFIVMRVLIWAMLDSQI